MTKADIVERVQARTGFTKQDSLELVESVFELLKVTMQYGEKVKISGFGNFEVRDKLGRKGRNPQTGEEISIDARRILTFKPSPILKQAVNSKP